MCTCMYVHKHMTHYHCQQRFSALNSTFLSHMHIRSLLFLLINCLTILSFHFFNGLLYFVEHYMPSTMLVSYLRMTLRGRFCYPHEKDWVVCMRSRWLSSTHQSLYCYDWTVVERCGCCWPWMVLHRGDRIGVSFERKCMQRRNGKQNMEFY